MTVRALSPGWVAWGWSVRVWGVGQVGASRQGSTMARLARAHIAAVAAVVALAGCTSSPEPTLPSFGTTPTATASSPSTPTAVATSTASAAATAVDKIDFPDLPSGLSAEQQAVGRAWQAYWRLAWTVFRTPKEPNSDLGKVMTGRALGLFNGYVDKLKLEGRHLEGSTTFWVDSISVSDGTATGCGRLVDFSHEVDDVTGESKEPINPRVRVMSATFVKSGDLWRISSSTKGGC